MKIKNLNDEQVIGLVIDKNKKYYSYIIDRYELKLFNYLNRITNKSVEVEDLVQETFIKVYENLQGFNQKKKFSSWIYRIAHNLAINWLRKKKITISINQSDFNLKYLIADQDIFKNLINKEATKKIVQIINNLPEKYKEPFILKFMEEKSYEEISDILRKPKNTIGTMINRARKILKEKLKNL